MTARERLALVFRGDREMRESGAFGKPTLVPVAAALAEAGLSPEPAVYAEDMVDRLRDQLLGVAGVLVWVDPVTGGEDRSALDGLLRDVASTGVWVSAHPDVIGKMGTKEVLHRTRDLGWGSDTRLYGTAEQFEQQFPSRLSDGQARVLKQTRGNGGIGVFKVQLAADQDVVYVQGARARDETIEEMPLVAFVSRCAKYFAHAGGDGRLVEQPFEPRIADGIIRAYLVGTEVVGFCRQYPAPTHTPDRVFGLPSAKTMFGPDEPQFQRLRRSLEDEWVPAMQRLVAVDDASLPALWDADFLFGRRNPRGEDDYVLGEINVSSVSPFPQEAVATLARAVLAAITTADPSRS